MVKTFSIKTLGCKLNQYESSLIAGQFINNGWVSKPFGETVDLVVVNTCTVTNRSDKKCRNYIRQGAAFSKAGKVVVTGCLAESKENVLNEMPEVFAVVKNSDKEKIFRLINNYDNLRAGKDKSNFSEVAKFTENLKEENEFPLPFYRTRGLLKIQDGCDGECSYCIVPSVRGKPVSRDCSEILMHARTLIDSGCPELILTGITIGKYNSNGRSISDLIKEITDMEGDFRVRITSIEPNHVSGSLIELFKNSKVCPHIHIPLQSGSEKILRSMRRPYTAGEYLKTVEKIRMISNDISIGTDIIIGFPGETEEDFVSNLKMIEEAGFSYVHQFTYSRRTGTPSSEMNECSPREVSDRAARLRDFAGEISRNYRKRFINRKLLSVIEKNKGKIGYTAVSGNYIKMLIRDTNEDLKGMTGKLTGIRLVKVERNLNTGELS